MWWRVKGVTLGRDLIGPLWDLSNIWKIFKIIKGAQICLNYEITKMPSFFSLLKQSPPLRLRQLTAPSFGHCSASHCPSLSLHYPYHNPCPLHLCLDASSPAETHMPQQLGAPLESNTLLLRRHQWLRHIRPRWHQDPLGLHEGDQQGDARYS